MNIPPANSISEQDVTDLLEEHGPFPISSFRLTTRNVFSSKQ